MPTPPVKDAVLIETLRVYEEQGRHQERAASALGISRSGMQTRLKIIKRRGITLPVARDIRSELVIPEPPDPNEPIEELVARKKLAYQRMQTAEQWSKLIPVTVKDSGPVVICAVGDPHLDDDLCDIGGVERDMSIIGKTPGMYALHVGDVTNNWVGRLGRLYAHQKATADDAMRLVEWMFKLAPPLAVVGGNHDGWNEGMNWLRFMTKQAGTDITQEHGVRINLMFPGDRSLRIHTRHDFPGHSQFNPLHGLRKEHLFGFRDHINIAGHRHTDSYAAVPSPEGYVQHMLRVSGYKAHDAYAKSLNLHEMKMAPTVGLFINPDANNRAEIVKPFWDLEEAADWLTYRRRRAA